jgi:NAD(P)-dependent dehydrogenase (short-subunit alcohol dehydrogenase family)
MEGMIDETPTPDFRYRQLARRITGLHMPDFSDEVAREGGGHPMTAAFDLSDRIALITGGHKGLGLAMARGLAAAGADLVLTGRDDEGLVRAQAAIEYETGASVDVLTADLFVRGEAQSVVARAIDAAGRVDILINNAGVSVPQRHEEVGASTCDDLLALNLTASMWLSRAVVPGMRERRWGRIVHVSSAFTEISAPPGSAYPASKAGLRGLARSSAIDLGPYGITVNCIAPGTFATHSKAATLRQGERQRLAEATALGRWGDPSELVGPAVLLASDAGSYITGTTLFVDGGYAAF